MNPLAGRAVLLGLLLASALAALGRFSAAFALLLGTAAAAVGALWLGGFVERLAAPGQGGVARIDWRFGLKTVLRYAVIGLLLWGAVRLFPAEVPWLLAGVSTVVAALVAEGIAEAWRGRRGR